MGDWKKNLREVVPYVPGEQPKGDRLIKLNTNENPYPPAPGVERILRTMDTDAFRKYPDPAASELKQALSAVYRLPEKQIFVGVGSDDVLAMAFLTCFHSGKAIRFPDVTYSFYPVWAQLFGIPYECPALDADFAVRPEDFFHAEGGVVIANPNAPTGRCMPLDQVEEIVRHNPDVVVIVDEAYIDFGGVSARTLIDRYENLLVVQTFSKSRSMAGMRIGYAFGSEALIAALENVKYSYNSYTMNLPSILCGAEALRDQAYFEETVGKIVRTREHAKERFGRMGFSFPDSAANFLFVTHERVPAKQLFEELRREQIYVRYFNAPRLSDYLRITIGTDSEMETLYEFLEQRLKRD